MAKIYRVEHGWQSHNGDRYTSKEQKVKNLTAGCVCDACPKRHGCRIECSRFKYWVSTGKS